MSEISQAFHLMAEGCRRLAIIYEKKITEEKGEKDEKEEKEERDEKEKTEEIKEEEWQEINIRQMRLRKQSFMEEVKEVTRNEDDRKGMVGENAIKEGNFKS